MKLSAVLHTRYLITGALGQLGPGLARELRIRHGVDSVICSDIVKPSRKVIQDGPFMFADVTNKDQMQSIIVTHDVSTIIHLSALLSAVAERNVQRAMEVNIGGFNNVLQLCHQYGLRLYCPSTIGAFGPDTPRDPTPNMTIQRPRTIYGVTKVHMELIGEYYHYKHGLDFRCLRYPGIISSETQPGGGTTDYAVDIFHHAISQGEYTCFLRPDTKLPMMHVDDCIRGTVDFMSVPSTKLALRTYNLAAMSFTPEELAAEICKHIPNFKIHYKVDPLRQGIADSWPQSFDDHAARIDWNWGHNIGLGRLVELMLSDLSKTIGHK